MRVLLFIPVVLSIIVLGAHFLRGGSMLVVLGVLTLLALLPFRRPWVARVVQLVLILGALEWVRTLVMLTMRRSARGEPFLRMAVILGAVAAVTLGSGLLLESEAFRRFYGSGRDMS
jgi:hypothetical protein